MINVVGVSHDRENMTLGSIKAIEESDIIIGYKKYIDYIEDLIEDKKVIKKGMGNEIARAEIAIEKNFEGKNVALISSGDPGVFGMANVLYQIESRYENFKIKVYPGITSLNYSADLLGAPLNDFVAISLSNILTPLSEIENKIKHSLESNLIIAIYNPISKTRKEPFRRFRRLVEDIRGSDCLVGIVEGTDDGPVTSIVKISNLNEDLINMSCTLIVGNDLTYIQDGYMITPRGYVIESEIHPFSRQHYEKFLMGEVDHGPKRDCDFYPCHYDGQYCDFCYCPFYPCGDGSTGGSWIKGKNVWDCKDCSWIHSPEGVRCIRDPLTEVLKDVDDLKDKKKTLLKLRRACLLKNDPYDL